MFYEALKRGLEGICCGKVCTNVQKKYAGHNENLGRANIPAGANPNYIGTAARTAVATNADAGLHAGVPSFANNEGQFRVAAFDRNDVTLPILDGLLHVGDGLAILRDKVRIELVAIESLYVDKVRRQKNRGRVSSWHAAL